jgi:lysylphosphatidylglycerol synthetase-like protein (DUF2156 family)
MSRTSFPSRAILDIGIVALLVALLAVLANKQAFSPPVHSGLLFALLAAATAIGWWREARREKRLDELQLASESFGARWSAAVLSAVALLLLFATPLQDAIVWFDQAYEDNEGRPLPGPVGVFLIGFVFAVMLHLTAKSALGAAWLWTKR